MRANIQSLGIAPGSDAESGNDYGVCVGWFGIGGAVVGGVVAGVATEGVATWSGITGGATLGAALGGVMCGWITDTSGTSGSSDAGGDATAGSTDAGPMINTPVDPDQSTGQSSSGDQSTGQSSSGDQSTGQSSSGDQSSGQSSSGDQSSGQSSSGDQSSGQSSSGDQSSGQSSSGDQSSGQSGSGDQSGGQGGKPNPENKPNPEGDLEMPGPELTAGGLSLTTATYPTGNGVNAFVRPAGPGSFSVLNMPHLDVSGQQLQLANAGVLSVLPEITSRFSNSGNTAHVETVGSMSESPLASQVTQSKTSPETPEASRLGGEDIARSSFTDTQRGQIGAQGEQLNT